MASSPEICIASPFINKPIFLSLRWSYLVNFDLSHPETFSFTAQTEAPVAMFLVRLVRGGMAAKQ
jgi:hypothetical protein